MDTSSFSSSEDSAAVEVANEWRSQEESWKKEATRIRKQQKKIKAAIEDSWRIRLDFTLTTRADSVVLSNETFVPVREIRERSCMTREETRLMKADLVLLDGRVDKVRKDVQQMKMEKKGVKGSMESFEVRLDGILRRLNVLVISYNRQLQFKKNRLHLNCAHIQHPEFTYYVVNSL
ncbi:hypothetical protein BDN70DRAFT_925974 [Pholiota conissans]|uniref:Uncharacterized protein n=1 Tax=Pholiota conissans TaxID=109636 RepID=A0A9P5YL55_9AGAR|nr:hypothetical protein BDN70DRAFT_925974 [Pholiota conissans]